MTATIRTWKTHRATGGQEALASLISSEAHIAWPIARQLAQRVAAGEKVHNQVEFITETRMTHVDGENAAPDWHRLLWRATRHYGFWRLMLLEVLPAPARA